MSLPLIFQSRLTLSGTRRLWVSWQRCNYPTVSTINWVRNFFTDRHHCTRAAICWPVVDCRRYQSQRDTGLRTRTGVLPSYVATAADLHPCTTGNRIFKHADDTYLVVPAANSSMRCQEIEQIGVWAAQNNLKLNSGKTKEMVIRGRGKRGKSANLPALCPGIERVSSICILGVTVNDQLSAADHVNSSLGLCINIVIKFL